MSAAVQLLVLAAALVGFWAIVMRPARRHQRAMAQFQADLAIDDEVVLSSGIFGKVVGVENTLVELEIAPGTVIRVARQAVVRRLDPPDTTLGTTADGTPDTTGATGTNERGSDEESE